MAGPSVPAPARKLAENSQVNRWLCSCQDPPVLLATYDDEGRVNIKVRDRYWHCQGRVQTICPKCGQEHILERPMR